MLSPEQPGAFVQLMRPSSDRAVGMTNFKGSAKCHDNSNLMKSKKDETDISCSSKSVGV